jgi:tetraacyldisaccharide 4'-kinase
MSIEGRGPASLARLWDHADARGADALLALLANGYRGLLGVRAWLYEHGLLRSRTLPCPVVSIGNLTIGGTGKTPAVELAVRTLCELGHRPGVVSRGYRRKSGGIQVVADSAAIRLDPRDAGDEPFLLARRLPGVPVVVGSNRYAAARLAVERFGVTAIVLDDGFQHRTLGKNLEIVMARARRPWGNGRLLPGGPMREPLDALARAHLVVGTGADGPEDLVDIEASVRRYAPRCPVAGARYVPVECWEASRLAPVPLATLAGRRLAAFAGIASPTGFAGTLDALGVAVPWLTAFGDHHWYSRADLVALERRAAAAGADGLVTTEKDWVRLRTLPSPARPLYVVSIRLELIAGETDWRRVFEAACPRP